MKRSRSKGLLITAACVIGLACMVIPFLGSIILSSGPPHGSDVGPVYVRPASASSATIDGVYWEYVAVPERHRQIFDGYPQLRIGQTREEVRALMGPPDFVKPLGDTVFAGWAYSYDDKRREADWGGPADRSITVYFSPENTVRLVRTANFPPVEK
jgi:hypothetical protein